MKVANGARRCLAIGLMLLNVCIMDLPSTGLSSWRGLIGINQKACSTGRYQNGRALKGSESDEQLQQKPVEAFQTTHVWEGGANRFNAAGSSQLCRQFKVARAGTFGKGTHGSTTKGDGASGADVKIKPALRKEVCSRAARRKKHKPLFRETPVERRATMEVEGANPSWDAREKEITT